MLKMFGKSTRTFLILFLFLFHSAGTAQINIPLKFKRSSLPFGLTGKVISCKPSIGLALSGGGARGLAQLGVLKAFRDNQIDVDIIAGTSMGSIIGGMYAAGYSLEDIDSILVNTDWEDFFITEEASRNELYVDQKITEDRALFSMRLDGLTPILPTSIISGRKATNFLNLISINAPLNIYNNFDQLIINFKAVCTDLVTGNMIILNNGSLSEAMRASSSVTFLLPPVKKDSLLLVDGGLVANIPTEIVKEYGGDIIIAVNTTSPLRSRKELEYPWNIADQILSIPMKLLNERQLNNADVVVTPVLKDITNTDFSNPREVITAGYNAAIEVVDSIKERFESELNKRGNETHYSSVDLLPFDSEDEFENELVNYLKNNSEFSGKDISIKLNDLIDINDYSEIGVEIDTSGNDRKLNLILEDNPPIKDVAILGASALQVESFRTVANGLINKPYNEVKLFRALLDILRLYRKEGFSLAEIEDFRLQANGTLMIWISEGVVTSVEISGNEKTNRTVIEREFPIHKGELFHYRKASEGLNNLRATNLFENVEIKTNKNDGTRNLKLKVVERPSAIMRFGLRIDNEYLSQLSLDIRDENIFGTGTELGTIISGGLSNRVYSVEHKSNRIFDTYLTYKLRGFYEFNDVKKYSYETSESENVTNRNFESEYRQIFYGVSFGLGAQVKKVGTVIFEAKYHNNEIKNKENYSGSIYKIGLFSFKLGFSIDSQNKYPFPTDGFWVKSYYETAQTILGGELGYSKLFVQYRSFTSIAADHTLSPKFQFGFADDTLPLSQQFSMGGQYSFFGYRDFEFRGRQILIGSLEYRYHLPVKLFFDTFLKARYDIGSVWATREEIRFKDLKHGLGAMLSIDTPIGPAEFAVGRSFTVREKLPKSKIIWGPYSFYFRIGFYY